MPFESTVDWVIVGGGAAGLTSALALKGKLRADSAQSAGDVVLLDAHRLAHGSSLHNPGRGQGGFHYPDRQSAEDLQEVLVHNMTHYPHWFSDYFSYTPAGQPVRSWYAVLPDGQADNPRSFYSNDETVALFDDLADRWDEFRTAFPELNQIGAEPFMEWVSPHVAAETLGSDRYFRVARTLEPNLDVPRFLANLEAAVRDTAGVTILEHERVVTIQRLVGSNDGANFELTVVSGDRVDRIRTRNLNIAAWEATEDLLAPLGYQFDTLNRIKCGFHLTLNPASVNFPSTLAIYGPHAMVRNYFDGTAFCTVAKVTNVVKERIPDVDGRLSELIIHRHDHAEELAERVRQELAVYYPALAVNAISDPQFGIVKVFSQSGKIDLYDPHGDQNRRLTNGYSTGLGDGLWITWSMKLVSCFRAAEQFRDSVLAASLS